jgi:hypothetical protein
MRPVSEAINHYEKVLASMVGEVHGHLLEWAYWARLGDDWLTGMGWEGVLAVLAIHDVVFNLTIDAGPVDS